MAKKYPSKRWYTPETLDETMTENVETLAESVIGHKIVSVEKVPGQRSYDPDRTVITLDNGTQVDMSGSSDCCAYTEMEAFLLHPDSIDHVITGVGTTDQYQTWHIYADMGDVLKLTVGWSEGSGYYGYGFSIQVRPQS